MPSRNTVKTYAADSYYHVYNRGVAKQKIFHDNEDYAVFLNLFKRYLDVKPTKDVKGREYEWLRNRLELLSYCLMPNHFHLLIYTHDEESMPYLLKAISAAYTVYYNKKYQRVGPLFQGRYKASHVVRDDYLAHISRYIHLNPKAYKSWEYSSYQQYMRQRSAGWLQPERIMGLFSNDPRAYEVFVADYIEYKNSFDDVKSELANY